MLLQNKSFNINEYKIPKFTLAKGKMIRFWVEIILVLENDTDGYWGVKKMQETIKAFNQKKEIIRICPNKIKRGNWDFINPITAGKYLEKRFHLNKKEVRELLSQFEINPEFKIKNLGTAHQKVFSIICGLQENLLISFDYYGLSPNTEELLTKFVKEEIQKGKAAISLDNLYYKPEKLDSGNIINLDILRTERIKLEKLK